MGSTWSASHHMLPNTAQFRMYTKCPHVPRGASRRPCASRVFKSADARAFSNVVRDLLLPADPNDIPRFSKHSVTVGASFASLKSTGTVLLPLCGLHKCVCVGVCGSVWACAWVRVSMPVPDSSMYAHKHMYISAAHHPGTIYTVPGRFLGQQATPTLVFHSPGTTSPRPTSVCGWSSLANARKRGQGARVYDSTMADTA